jgi:hypothetical protein
MLIEIDRLQPELKIILVEPGTKKRITSTKNVQLVITHPPQSEAVPLTKIIRTVIGGIPLSRRKMRSSPQTTRLTRPSFTLRLGWMIMRLLFFA